MRRRLIFNVPAGKEQHYSKIKGSIAGRVWAPLYHGYGYYLPASLADKWDDARMKQASINNAIKAAVLVATNAAFGWKSMAKAGVGGIVWAEAESIFATWDGHVTFGTSHIMGHAAGFFLVNAIREMLARKSSWKRISFIAVLGYLSVDIVYDFVKVWARGGFSPVSGSKLPHRVDNVAHIGGLLTGALNGYYASL
jgi:hypothetical protein